MTGQCSGHIQTFFKLFVISGTHKPVKEEEEDDC